MALLADEKCSKFFRAKYRTELTVADVRRKLLQHDSWICNIFCNIRSVDAPLAIRIRTKCWVLLLSIVANEREIMLR